MGDPESTCAQCYAGMPSIIIHHQLYNGIRISETYHSKQVLLHGFTISELTRFD